MKERGLERYYLLTNVSGTSHYKSGSIDRVNDWLTKELDITAYCWWRDDLDRRVDTNSSIKWSFPDILRGSDLLQFLYEGKFDQDSGRRLTAIKAYLAHQHKYDSQLKFKQVDLEKGLVDLFVDVPASAVGPSNPRDATKWREQFERSPVLSALVNDDRLRHRRGEEERIGAVRVLVDAETALALPRVVIEGAPGQGKSTVTQFLCQLHRISLLKRNWEMQRVPVDLRPTDVRLPLRVDLRDYATWLSGRNPFQENNAQSQHGIPSPALESFLAAQISAQSGGLQFSPDDLLAFAANSALLIVLDGFDEVADIATRNRLVREVADASARFEGNTISSQIIVTSRPAAFANSPGFSRDEWQYIQILPLTKTVIDEYSEKWMSGHNLDNKERRDLTSVLSEKLEYPHVRELARNPMQLAILLALISTQGSSLPDKRTTLYDRYIDIFFNRESEKSKVVRDKRDLLVDMHRYLAWTLQVEAESNAKAGNISEQRLREVLQAYLVNVGHDPKLVDDLFSGMVERVVALVSRVQGTFEFEVQPLREYFAARYLYDTAPYIQAGSSRSGSIMDRFDALAKNAYWLNVTRFYCGCYSSGELPSLIDGIIHLGQSDQYKGTNYISELAQTLLADYVFSQQPRSVSRLTDFLLERTRFRLMLANAYGERADGGMALPEESGRGKLLDSAIAAYKGASHVDTAYASAAIVKANLGSLNTAQVWQSVRSAFPEDQALYFGSFLNIIENMPELDLLDLVEKGGSTAIRMCVYRNRPDILNTKPDFWQKFVELLLDSSAAWLGYHLPGTREETRDGNCMRLIIAVVSAISTLSVAGRPHGRTLLSSARRFGYSSDESVTDICKIVQNSDTTHVPRKDILAASCDLVTSELSQNETLGTKISSFLGLMLRDFGYRSLIIDAGTSAVDWLSSDSKVEHFHGLLATLKDVKDHARDAVWWKKRLASVTENNDRFLIIKAFLTWSDGVILFHAADEFSDLVEQVSPSEFHSLYESCAETNSPFRDGGREAAISQFNDASLENINVRAASLIYSIVDAPGRDAIFTRVLKSYSGSDEDITEASLNGAWEYAIRNPEYWHSALSRISAAYSQGVLFDRLHIAADRVELPAEEAMIVTQSPEAFPLVIVGLAERVLAEKAGAQVIPLGNVADTDRWFSD